MKPYLYLVSRERMRLQNLVNAYQWRKCLIPALGIEVSHIYYHIMYGASFFNTLFWE